MKRFCIFLLIFCFVISGCSLSRERIKEPVTFYYLNAEYQFFSQDGVIVSEEREASGHRDDLSYLMALYLMGPSQEGLISPIPRGTRIYFTEQTADNVTLKLSDTAQTMSDIDFSLACACLSLTCLGLTDSDTITIISGERSVTMGEKDLTLFDTYTIWEEST